MSKMAKDEFQAKMVDQPPVRDNPVLHLHACLGPISRLDSERFPGSTNGKRYHAFGALRDPGAGA